MSSECTSSRAAAGTTWIYQYLQSRDDICLPYGVKETMFFDKFYCKSLKWYENHFKNIKSVKKIIEVAPTYFHHNLAPERIYGTLGNIPLLFTLRNPANRCYSLFLHMRRYGMTKCTDFIDAAHKHPEIIQTSRYAYHLKTGSDFTKLKIS